jgi:hypothetical protein
MLEAGDAGVEHETLSSEFDSPHALDLRLKWSEDDMAIRLILAEKPVFHPGTHFLGNDI